MERHICDDTDEWVSGAGDERREASTRDGEREGHALTIIQSSLSIMECVHQTALCVLCSSANKRNEEDIIDNVACHSTEHVCCYFNEPRDKNIHGKNEKKKI